MRYTYNYNAFEQVETEFDAYWLGFILADGYVSKAESKPFLQIKLANKDRNHLVKFIHYMGYETEEVIKECYGGAYTKDNLCNVVKIGNKRLANNLHRYNLNGAKSTKEEPYCFDNEFLDKAYVRGIFDGDGSIVKDGRITLVGSYKTCEYFKTFLEKYLPIQIDNNILQHGKIFRTQVTAKEKVKMVLDYLYKDANIYLDRKYAQYKQMYY